MKIFHNYDNVVSNVYKGGNKFLCRKKIKILTVLNTV